MVLTEQIAVMDLIAFGQFLLLPEDDLTLATVLKSPLIGLDEETLFTIAHDRDGTLWDALKHAAGKEDALAPVRAAHELLARYLSVADYLSPYDLFSEILSHDGGRRRLLARLGLEADDPIGEFMSLALAYDRQSPPSLQGFLHWLVSGQAEIKRDLEQGVRDEVRIMTVHGAKGLQAPIVFLPDDMQLPNKLPRLLWAKDDDDEATAHLPLWLVRSADRDAVTDAECAQAQRKRDQEYRRLLYVALTRAEDRLYVCGWRGKRDPAPGCWYNLVRDGLDGRAEATEFDFTAIAGAAGWTGAGLRLDSKQEAKPDNAKAASGESDVAAAAPLPAWARETAAPEPKPSRPLAPSRPDPATESEPALVSPLAVSFGDTTRFQRGLIIHRLLQSLPDLAPDARGDAAQRYLARPVFALADDMQAEIAAEVAAVLADARFAALFGPDSRAEVPITGQLGDGFVVSGQIDRLVVLPDRILVVDYKSNRPPPKRVADVPAIYLRQLAAYRALLHGVYPGRTVTCALLWTDGPLWMEIPAELLDRQGVGTAP
jgi:ATP-dependent helicase/nuclease subunit A